MFRSSNRDSDQSDDEKEFVPIQRPVEQDLEPKKKRANNVWSDVVMEQSLQDKSARVSIEHGSKGQKINRGAESYALPADAFRDELPKIIPPIVAVTPASDDPFGDTVDLSAVEGFGVNSYQPRGGGRGRPMFRQRGGRDGPSTSMVGPSSTTTGDEAMVTGDQPNPDGASWMRGRGRGRIWQNRGGFNGRGRGFGPPGLKRQWDNHGRPLDPAKLVTREYSLETMMATEFTAGIALPQLGLEIAQAMGEYEPTTVVKIVEAIGEEKAITLFEETRQVESAGGMKTIDGSRRRTPGGVFISLFKSDHEITPEVKDKIFEMNKQGVRNFKKAKRKKNFGDSIKEVAELMQKEKDGETNDDDLPPLKDVTEALTRTDPKDVMDDSAEQLDFDEMDE